MLSKTVRFGWWEQVIKMDAELKECRTRLRHYELELEEAMYRSVAHCHVTPTHAAAPTRNLCAVCPRNLQLCIAFLVLRFTQTLQSVLHRRGRLLLQFIARETAAEQDAVLTRGLCA